ncbi:hypothetical protein FH972_015294 [Carpinus fangiana]|uniref:Uncharacterized protein n=1 Tax=Carpinus fangiana TaxID=176857 RepID=A0A5N6RCW5_9ROSI|nr:hypothetical protein FH972_015294 [Carpinus fangiana]
MDTMEDRVLTKYIKTHGEGKWRNLPKREVGWPPSRTDNEIKNYWNTNIGKKIKMGDHHPKRRPSSSTPSQPQLQEINPNPSMAFAK